MRRLPKPVFVSAKIHSHSCWAKSHSRILSKETPELQTNLFTTSTHQRNPRTPSKVTCWDCIAMLCRWICASSHLGALQGVPKVVVVFRCLHSRAHLFTSSVTGASFLLHFSAGPSLEGGDLPWLAGLLPWLFVVGMSFLPLFGTRPFQGKRWSAGSWWSLAMAARGFWCLIMASHALCALDLPTWVFALGCVLGVPPQLGDVLGLLYVLPCWGLPSLALFSAPPLPAPPNATSMAQFVPQPQPTLPFL